MGKILCICKKFGVRVIAKSTLREYWEKHNIVEQALLTSYNESKKADWSNFNEVKLDYPSARIVGNNRIIFNIKGNDYKLIVKVNFEFKTFWIRFIGTHAE